MKKNDLFMNSDGQEKHQKIFFFFKDFYVLKMEFLLIFFLNEIF